MTSYSDEIDLRAYIDVLWRWRWFLITIVVLAGLSAGLLSFFVLTPVYEASGQIMVPKDPLPAEIILSPGFMQRIIDELNLPADRYTPFTLSRYITVEASRTSASLTTVKVQNSDPNLAASIANTITKDFLAFVKDKSIEAISSSISYLEAQKETAVSQLSKYRAERDAIRQSGRLEALQREADRLSYRVIDHRSQLSSGQVRERELLKGVAELENVIAVTPAKVQGPPDWSGHATEIPNETYQRLEQSLAFKKVELSELRVRLQEIQAILPTLEEEYAGAYARLVSLQRQLQDLDVSISELTAQTSTLESRMNQLVVNLPQTGLVTQVVTPERPIRPRKLLNVAVASVLGGFVSVFAVFFIEYWRSPRKDTQTSLGAS